MNYIILNSLSVKAFDGMITPYFMGMLQKQESFFAIGAICDDTACGYMICERTGEGYIIHDILVHPDYRRRGVGRGLLESLIHIAYHMMEDIDCCFIEREDASLRLLFESMKVFETEEDGSTGTYEVTLEELAHSKFLKPFKGMNEMKNCCMDFYDDFLPFERKALVDQNPSIGSTPVSIPLERDDITKYCFAAMDAKKEKFAAFIKVNDGGDALYVESLWYKKGYEKQLVAMLAATLSKALKEKQYKLLRTCVVDEDVFRFFKHIAPEARQTGRGYSVWWNYELSW